MRLASGIIVIGISMVASALFAQTPQITVDLAQPTGDVIGLGHNLPYYDVGAGLWDSADREIKGDALDPLRYAGMLAGTSGRAFIRYPAGDAAAISECR